MTNLKNHIAGALYGVAVGDALGGPLEFMTAEQIKKTHGRVTTMIGGGWLNLRPGETTDDTAMTLAVAEGIIANPEDPTEEIGRRFLAWADSGPKDIGGTCAAAIYYARAEARTKGLYTPDGLCWASASRCADTSSSGRSAGNGALMRTIYPAIYYPDREKATAEAGTQSRMTHWDMRSVEACKIYADVVHCFIAQAKDGKGPEDFTARLADTILLPTHYNPDRIIKNGEAGGCLTPSGYVVSSLECALYAFWTTDSFKEAVAEAANMGGDADTIAAICGGLAGAYYGLDHIPEEWTGALSKADRSRLDAAVDAAVENWTTGRK